MTLNANPPMSKSLHRLAVLLACATFPVIWVGGLVTTYDAGMAFPDWPTTHGYNVFLYPWQTWLSAPWDLFIEHGHRLLVAGVIGPVMLALTVFVYLRERRTWVRRLTWAAALLVVVQAVLGGLRVRLDERLLAQIHACVGPAFFAVAAALATVTSRRWQADSGFSEVQSPKSKVQSLPRLATATATLAYAQLVLGSQLRHVQVTTDAMIFRIAVWFHLIVAAVLATHVVLLWSHSWREMPGNAWIRRPADLLLALIGVQLALGCGAWVVNYGWPAWMGQYSVAAGYVVQRESLLQATMTTAHVAVGSLILAIAVVLALRAWRMLAQASGVRRQASGYQTSVSETVTSTRRRIGEAQFAICDLQFAICNSCLVLGRHCKLQIANCKLWNWFNVIERAASEGKA